LPTPRSRYGEKLLLEERIQRRLGLGDLVDILGHECIRLRLEMITEVRLGLAANLLRRRLPTVLGLRCVVFDAHTADVQLRITGLADIQAPKREAQRG
jgi:hypothetical protein